jgi:threonine-phosphate decarboxylase
MTELRPLHGGQLRQIVDHFGIPAAQLLDFSANINPEGPPATVLSCLRASIDKPWILTCYPDLEEVELRKSLAHYAGVRPDNLTVANGFVPLLDAVLRTLPIRNCLVPMPAFGEYRRALQRSHIELMPHILTPDSDFLCRTAGLFTNPADAILLANPQNPSGVLASRETLVRIAQEAAERNTYVLLDEAFIDYCPETSLTREIDRFPNLIVFRSVTKFFGIAGLRVGYAVADIKLSRQLQKTIAPWLVSTLASLAAGVAVRDQAYARHTIRLNEERRAHLETGIRNLGIYVYPSAANFLLLRFPDAVGSQQFWERLIRDYHIVLRNCANYEALGRVHLRAAVRTRTENERLIEALACEVENGR